MSDENPVMVVPDERYNRLLLATLEQMSERIEAVAEEGRTGRRALRDDLAEVRHDVAAMREEFAGARVRLGVLWAGASALGGAIVIGITKLIGAR